MTFMMAFDSNCAKEDKQTSPLDVWRVESDLSDQPSDSLFIPQETTVTSARKSHAIEVWTSDLKNAIQPRGRHGLVNGVFLYSGKTSSEQDHVR